MVTSVLVHGVNRHGPARRTLETALAEVRYHQERFLRRTNESPIRLELRLYSSNLDANLTDVRKLPGCHIPDDYGPGQRLGRP